jgi:hypothetical protein
MRCDLGFEILQYIVERTNRHERKTERDRKRLREVGCKGKQIYNEMDKTRVGLSEIVSCTCRSNTEGGEGSSQESGPNPIRYRMIGSANATLTLRNTMKPLQVVTSRLKTVNVSAHQKSFSPTCRRTWLIVSIGIKCGCTT